MNEKDQEKKVKQYNKNIYPSSIPHEDTENGYVSTDPNELYRYVEAQAIKAINWYVNRKIPASRFSRSLRIGAIFFATIGGLFPILAGANILPNSVTAYAQYGYIALALAAACLGLDKYFGFSSAWMRYMTTQLNLQKLLAAFQMDWVILWSKVQNKEPTSEQQGEMLDLLKKFRLQILEEMEQETQTWITEFKDSLTQLEQTAKSRLEAKHGKPESSKTSDA